MVNITFAALHMRAQIKKTTFSCKDDCTLTKCIRRWTYSALRYFWVCSDYREYMIKCKIKNKGEKGNKGIYQGNMENYIIMQEIEIERDFMLIQTMEIFQTI